MARPRTRQVERTAIYKPVDAGPTWQTHDELAFVRGLGTYAVRKIGSRVLLERYRDSMDKRADWGAIDVVVIWQEVQRLLHGLH